jgi:lactam utilization protein B
MRLLLTAVDQAALIKPVLRTFVSLEDYAAARVALRAFTKAPMTHKQRNSAKAAVLNIFARRIYFARGDTHVRRSAQILLARMSVVDWGLNEMVGNTHFWRRSLQARRLEFAENDLRPLAFLLGQALQLHGQTKGYKKLNGVPEEARAVHEMEGPLREHRRKAVERMRQRLEAQSLVWHSDSKTTLDVLHNLLIRRSVVEQHFRGRLHGEDAPPGDG